MPRIARSESIHVDTLSAAERHALGEAIQRVASATFETDARRFYKLVVAPNAVATRVLVHRADDGRIVGFFMLHFHAKQLRGEPVAVLRVVMAVEGEYRRGLKGVHTSWCLRTILGWLVTHPGRPLYGISGTIHPATYAMTLRYVEACWPKPDEPVPAEILGFMLSLADEFGMLPIDPARPLVRDVGIKSRYTETERDYWQRSDKPGARFFVTMNPSYGEGHALLLLTRLTPGVIARGGGRLLVDAVRGLVSRWSPGTRKLAPDPRAAE